MSNIEVSGAVTVTIADPAGSTPTDDAAKEAKESRIAVATSLATGIAVLVASLGVFGGLTGAVARLARNFPLSTGVAVASVIVSVLLAVTARLVATGSGDTRTSAVLVLGIRRGDHRPYVSTAMLWVSAALLAFGLVLAVVQLTRTIDKDDRPSVSAQITRDADTGVASISGTAKAGGLAAADAIRVALVSYAEGDDEGSQTYYAVVGPSPDGVVDHAFTVVLPSDVRSVVITVGKDPGDTPEVPGACRKEPSAEQPADPTSPGEVVAASDEDEPLTACALVLIPDPPAPAPATGTASPSPGSPDTKSTE